MSMHATDRVVVVAAGFGVWHQGRHHSSAQWSDVRRVRAFKRDDVTTDLICVAMELRDGSEVVIDEELPGFDAFLAAAETRLPTMKRRAEWLPSIAQPAFARSEVVLFARA